MIKLIDGFEGYGVDESGQIYSCRKKKPVHDSKGQIKGQTVVLTDQWRVVKGGKTTGGYLNITLRKNNRSHTKRVHILVAKAFLPNPSKFLYVCHNDGDPKNNVATNLRWDSASNNQQDRKKHGTYRLTKWKLAKIKSLYASGDITKNAISILYKLPMDVVEKEILSSI